MPEALYVTNQEPRNATRFGGLSLPATPKPFLRGNDRQISELAIGIGLRMHALHYLSSWRLVASFVGEVVVVVVVPLSVKIKKSSMLPTDVRMGVLL